MTVRPLFADAMDCSICAGLETAREWDPSGSFHVFALIIEIHRPEVIKPVKILASMSKYQRSSAALVSSVFQTRIHKMIYYMRV